MSFRHPFVTDFIYDAANEPEGSNRLKKMAEVLGGEVFGHDGYGYIAGILKTLSLGSELSALGIEEVVRELESITEVPFRLTIMMESGPVITYRIEHFDWSHYKK